MQKQSGAIKIIAEMACSHEGDPQLAKTIIDGAGEAGADIIQLQIWEADRIMVPSHSGFETLKKIELERSQWKDIVTYIRSKYPSVEVFACVYDLKSVDFCQELLVDGYKLHSSDLSNPVLIKHVAATGKQVDLSVGASTREEMTAAIEWIRETSGSPICIMYGFQNFPTPIDAINLDHMMELRGALGLPIAYQDHSDADADAAFWLPAAAAGMGVDVLEKHITHDRSLKGVDHEAALNPDEFAKFVSMVREVEAARGTAEPAGLSEEELKYRAYSKKSIVAARAITKEEVINEQDLLFMRAETLGLPPAESDKILGKSAKRDLAAYELILEEDVN